MKKREKKIDYKCNRHENSTDPPCLATLSPPRLSLPPIHESVCNPGLDPTPSIWTLCTLHIWPLTSPSQATPISPAHLCMRHRTLRHCFYSSIWSLLDRPFDPAATLMSSRQCDATSRIGYDVWLSGCRCRRNKRVRGKLWVCVCS